MNNIGKNIAIVNFHRAFCTEFASSCTVVVASLMKLPGWEVYRQETVPTMTHKRRLDGLGITTAGESGLVRDYGPLTLTGVTMMVSTVMFGSALFVISSERLGGLDLYAGFSEDALDPADAADIMARVAEALEAAAA